VPDDEEEDLNSILVDCAKLRGSYPLIHRTLNEFEWFCTACIYGWTAFDQYRMDEAIRNYTGRMFDVDTIILVWDDMKTEMKMVYDRWNDRYCPGDDELVRFGIAFREYCEEVYDDEIIQTS
jgi:hypothetical protein